MKRLEKETEELGNYGADLKEEGKPTSLTGKVNIRKGNVSTSQRKKISFSKIKFLIFYLLIYLLRCVEGEY